MSRRLGCLILLGLSQILYASDNLVLLPENSRYLQYKGLPCVLFWGTHHWGWRGYPNAQDLTHSGTYANFITLQASEYRYSDYPALWRRAQDDTYWQRLKQSIKTAYERDILVHLYFYDGNYSPEEGRYDAPTRFFDGNALDEDLAAFGLPGKTRRDIHQALIAHAVQVAWEYPNVLFDPVFEMVNTYRWGVNADAFQRWWVSEFKQQGARRDPSVDHLFGTMWGGNGNYRDGKQSHPRGNQRESHPHERAMDVLIGEHTQDGFFVDPEDNSDNVYRWRVPMLRMALHAPEWQRDQVHDINGPAHALMIRQIEYGIHTGEHYNYDGSRWTTDLTSPALKQWMLQTRWYLENIRTWVDEPGRYGGDEITEDTLPIYAPSQRPVLTNPDGYTQGVRRDGEAVVFACMYKDADDDPPALAEVWVDANGDGRYDLSPNERFTLSATSKDYRRGVLFVSQRIRRQVKSSRYVFRFADRHWLPPQTGKGLVPLGIYTSLVMPIKNDGR